MIRKLSINFIVISWIPPAIAASLTLPIEQDNHQKKIGLMADYQNVGDSIKEKSSPSEFTPPEDIKNPGEVLCWYAQTEVLSDNIVAAAELYWECFMKHPKSVDRIMLDRFTGDFEDENENLEDILKSKDKEKFIATMVKGWEWAKNQKFEKDDPLGQL